MCRSLGKIADWILLLDSLDRYETALAGPPKFIPFSIQCGFWRPSAMYLEEFAEGIEDEDARTNLQLCAALLEGY
jgi:hypothetical protein